MRVTTIIFLGLCLADWLGAQNAVEAPRPNDHLAGSFLEGWYQYHPSEPLFLGIYSSPPRFADLSLPTVREEVSFLRATLKRMEAEASPPFRDDQLDHAVIRGICEFMIRYYVDHEAHLLNVKLATVPTAVLNYEIVQAQAPSDWRILLTRLRDVPRYLEQLKANLRLGLAQGKTADRGLTQRIIQRIRGENGAIVFFEDFEARYRSGAGRPGRPLSYSDREALAEAASAYEDLAGFLQDEYLPQCDESWRLGPTEYRRRWHEVFGRQDDPADFVQEARRELNRIHRKMLSLAGQQTNQDVTDLQELGCYLKEVFAATPRGEEAILEMYRRRHQRLIDFLVESELFKIPEGFELLIEKAPPGYHGPQAANWPARLRDSRTQGVFIVNTRVPYHAEVQAMTLTGHEGVPGHGLQSHVLQSTYFGDPAPVRFLLVSDLINAVLNHWGTHPNIEGWALYAEQVMLEQPNLYSDTERLAALAAQAFRAVRVIVDVGLHSDTMTPEQAQLILQEQAFLSQGQASRECARYQDHPLQATSYLLGRLAIEDLKKKWLARNQARTEAGFHEEFLRYGPLHPWVIAPLMLQEESAK